ncbi:excinuclease ABC subunit UvrA [Phytoactinopolyspora mesophila]|uniref:UvrABC system protein A n=1 Tax=Phytoactinopolyspora mesophila TaxID=2650750 RepID=A0A7K3LZ00_9ACTN|nr:excinuclease ABC subunit UvrA [Phytoactinopolyspora mesophila]NDL56047.1 ATP-binding cassette domain-containing protein [Phytoactinopolyspora mesophila]
MKRTAWPTPDPAGQPAADRITVLGAREHNLKNVTVEIPKGAVTVVTGVSGSGKSSLVFDTIAAESQRQFYETFPAYVRYRLPAVRRPDVDAVWHLSPAIVVDQRPLGRQTRSTVGTATEVYTLVRLLFSRLGDPPAGESTAFSFNDPRGMCDRCQGLGSVDEIDVERLVDRERSLNGGALRFPGFTPGTYRWKRYVESGLFDNDKPLRLYTGDEWHTLLHATGIKPERPGPGWPPTSTYEGVLPRFRRSFIDVHRDKLPADVAAAVDEAVVRQTCPDCGGARLNATALAARINGLGIADWMAEEVEDLIEIAAAVDAPLVKGVVSGIVERLESLVGVGLGYLTLGRDTPSLSGGEAQRVKLVRHLGSSLSGLTYVLDEPSVGLHPADVSRVNTLIRQLRDKGNTVVVVEHDPDVIAIADHVIDLGPGAGVAGGEVVYSGDLAGLKSADTPTGASVRRRAPLKTDVRTPAGAIDVTHAGRHNVGEVSFSIPKGVLTAVTGVAGSGKSTLMTEILPAAVGNVVVIDQAPVLGSRRSTPASYAGVLDPIRRSFARAHGVGPGMFSANSDGGCPECKGLGMVQHDLAFMDPVTIVCESCDGTRFRPEALAYSLRGRNIAEVLAMTVTEAMVFFDEPRIAGPLRMLDRVGLGYLSLNQPLTTLSGGERQRLKLAREFETAGGIYVFDEPTTGLHQVDTLRLVRLLDRLVDQGNTVIVIEHDIDVINRADWIIGVGPGAGRHGGRIVFEGPSAMWAQAPPSFSMSCPG